MNGKRSVTATVGLLLAFFGSSCGRADMTTNPLTNGTATRNTSAANTATTNAGDGKVDPKISREEFEKQKDRFALEAKEAGRKIGSGADDLWIWTKTRALLAAEDDLRDAGITVDVDNNVVTLVGMARNEEQRSKAEEITRGVEG